MSPFGIATSRSLHRHKVDTTRLWILLVGINKYADKSLPSLRYSAIDCQGLLEALTDAAGYFQNTTFKIHHDFAPQAPDLGNVCLSLQDIIKAAKPEDTVLFYFSGHGILGDNGDAFLCLQDTQTQNLAGTALGVSYLLKQLASCQAKNQMIWLDACHSGGMGLHHKKSSHQGITENITPQLVNTLQKSAAQGQGFYALLSCDNHQQSWEFDELGHGVFTYYLMQGLRGAAADNQGLIYVDSLYRYVYHQTLHYVDKYNQQLRLINQQNRSRGLAEIFTEYTLQTPKRIVEGVGDLIVGKQAENYSGLSHRRVGIVVDGLLSHKTTLDISKILRDRGDIELEYLQAGKSNIHGVKACLLKTLNAKGGETVLVYLRGKIEETEDWEGFIFGDNLRIKRSWLKQQLKRCPAKQIIILDCLIDPESNIDLSAWVQELHIDSPQGQCLIACAASNLQPKVFTQTLFDTLNTHALKNGLSAAGWISQLKLFLAGTELPLYLWLSGAQGIIEILPAQTNTRKRPHTQDLGVCPYMGLNAFTEQDSLYFHGREALVQELVHHLHNQPFLAVVGASGSGKSSVVQAGIIPALRQGKQIPDSQTWLIRNLRPGINPLKSLAQALEIKFGNSPTNSSVMEGIIYQGVESFVYWLRSRWEPMLVLAIDQFEELFTLTSAKEREEFLKIIFGALKYAPDRIKIIITLRADFITSCLEIDELAIALQRFSVLVPPHLSLDNYRRTIINPAQQVGLQVEPELVEVLLRDLNHSVGDLPLLEFVLEQLWQYRVNGQLTLLAYQEKLGGIQGALERSSQAVYDSLNPQMQACAKWIFLSLTQLGEGTEDTRRRVLKSELIVDKYPRELVEKTLKVLTDAKLIVMGLEDNLSYGGASRKGTLSTITDTLLHSHQVTVEVAHEILIRHWSTLRWWLEENRSRLRIQRQIEQAAQLWLENNNSADFLLQGVRLAEAEEIYIHYTDELSTDTQGFIDACLQERKLQQQQAKRRLRMTQMAVVVMGGLGLIACGLASFAHGQTQKAQLEEIRTLNSLSENYLTSRRQLDSLVTVMKAAKQLKNQSNWLGLNDRDMTAQAREITERNLNQAVVNIMEKNRLLKHASLVSTAKFSHDKNLIVTAGADKTIKLWQKNGKFVRTLKGHEDTINDIAFSQDGNIIASASEDKTIKLWQPNGELIAKIAAHAAPVLGIRYSPQRQQFISMGADGQIKFWQQDGTYVGNLPLNIPGISSLNLSRDATTIAIATESGEIIYINLAGEKQHSFILPPKYAGKISAIAFSPNNKTLSIGTSNGGMAILERSGKVLHEFSNHNSKITRLAYSPNSQVIASSSTDNTIKLWSLDGTLLQSLSGHTRTINDVDFSADSQTLVSASDDKSVRLWRLNTILPKTLRSHENDIVGLEYSPNGDFFASVSEDGTFNLFGKNGQLLRKFVGHEKAVNSVAFAADSQTIASSSVDNTIRIWQLDGKAIKTIPIQADWYTKVTFSPDGETLAYGNGDYTIKLWHLPSQQTKKLSGHSHSITSLSYAYDGEILASASLDNTIKLWSKNGSLIKTIPAHDALIWQVIFAPNGKFFASASQDGKIKIWQRSGELIRTIHAHNHEVNKISFSPDNKYIASASDDDTIKIWKVQTGKLVKTLTGHNGNVRSISFSPDNQYVVSGGADSTVRMWKFTTLASSQLDFDSLFARGCDWLGDYLENTSELAEEERNLCVGEK